MKQAVHGWLSTYERLVKSQNFFSSYLTQEDLSRLGREYIETGKYLEMIFPSFGVRFIAINDEVDSENSRAGDDIIIPVKNIMNEAYCRELSKKLRKQFQIQRGNGEFLGAFANYGYCKSPDDKHKLVVDDYAAEVVRGIFSLKFQGYNQQAIADFLNNEKVLSPADYKKSQGLKYKTGFKSSSKSYWSAVTVSRILTNPIYIGKPVQGNTFKVDEETAPIVLRIFQMRADRVSFNGICRELNLEGIPCPGKIRYERGVTMAGKYKGALWIRGTVRKITQDAVYIGCRIHGKVMRSKVGLDKKRRPEEEWKIIENAHPALVSKGDVRNTIVIDEPAAQVVRQIFEWAAAGITVTNIAQRLNTASIPTPSVYLADIRGKYKTRSSWSYESVRNILFNRIYTGDTVPFKSHVVRVGSNHVKQVPPELQQVIPDTHEAIISREQYYRALTVIKSVKKGRGIRSDNPFTSLLMCGCCGNRLSKGKEKNKTWLCSMHRYNPKTDCKSVRIDNDQLEQIVLRAISMQCRLLDAKVQSIKRESYSAKSGDQILRSECQSLHRQIDRIQDDKMTLYERYACGNIAKEVYVSEKDTLSAKEEELKVQYVMAEQKQALLKEKIRMSADRISAAEKVTPYQSLTKLTPELAKELIKRIIVRPDKSIRIEWNFSDELSGLVEFPEICFEKQAI